MKNISKDIIKFWHDLEFFAPCNPTISKGKFLGNKERVFPKVEDYGDKVPIFYVYIGEFRVDDLLVKMKERLNESDNRIEKDGGRTRVCGLLLDSKGCYIKDSFNLSSFFWSTSKIIATGKKDVELDIEKCEKFNEEINDYLEIKDQNLDYISIKELYEFILKKLDVSDYLELDYNILKIEYKIKMIDKKQSEKNTNDNIMISSFYIKDLKNIAKDISDCDKLGRLVKSKLVEVNEGDKTDLFSDVAAMQEILHPDKYPHVKWPSKFSPSLMQQVAINKSISDQEELIFSVNGPPGTGKTTLLKEIIASNIYFRADKMSEYENPSNAFTECLLKKPENNFLKKSI